MKRVIMILMILTFGLLFASENHEIRRDEALTHPKSEESTHTEHSDVVKLTDAQLKEFDIQLDIVKGGEINIEKRVTGEIIFNQNNVSHIVPIVSGRVKKVFKNLGEDVKKGDDLALIESRELAELKSQYLGVKAKKVLMQSNFDREKKLFEKKITSQKSYLTSQNELAEINIELSMIKNKLLAIGLSSYQINNIKSGKSLGNYIIKAPIDGKITQKHVSLGEYIKDENDIYTIADLSTVWVNITLYQNDLSSIKLNQKIRIESENIGEITEGKIDYLTPFIDEKTRTATARVIIDNKNGKWYPGMFVIGHIKVESINAAIIISNKAIQQYEGATVVFTKDEDGFEPTKITLGKKDSMNVQVLSGLKKGSVYVKKNSFSIKSELQKANFGDGHGH
jgi:cobalt-zinc-cadmium efflux system membrane fusion protein